MTFKEIREMTGLSRPAFCEKYKVPVRTQENWEAEDDKGKRTPPDYVVYLLERMIRMDYKVPIYGVSSVYQFEWTHTVYKFDDLQEAEEWLHTEEYKFAERELMNKEGAIKLAGEDAVNDPLEWENEYHG